MVQLSWPAPVAIIATYVLLVTLFAVALPIIQNTTSRLSATDASLTPIAVKRQQGYYQIIVIHFATTIIGTNYCIALQVTPQRSNGTAIQHATSNAQQRINLFVCGRNHF